MSRELRDGDFLRGGRSPVEDIPNAYVRGRDVRYRRATRASAHQQQRVWTPPDTAGHTVDRPISSVFQDTFEAKAKPMINECLSGSLG